MAKVALLIGVGNYEHPDALKPLVSAPKDVAAMQRILSNAQMGEFTEVIPLIDPDPMQMQEAIETLYRDRAKDDLVLLFFSGHGIKDDSGKLYFSTRVTRKTPKGELVKSTAVPARFVQEIMGNSRSRRQVMILDCCFSGAFDPALNAKDDGSLDVQGQLGAEGRVVLTSSSSTEYSFEQQGSELSIYTRFLVEGIETGAADQDNDSKVSVRELHEYATKKVQETAPKMNPKIIVLKDEGFDVVFAKAQIADPKLKYRKDAERYSTRGEISSIGRTVLDMQRKRLGLTLEEAQEIENQVLQPFRERLKHLENYRSAFAAEVERQHPLTLETLSELKDLQEIFGLRKEDVTHIEQEVTAQITSQSEAYQQKLEQQRQQDAESLRQQQEAERLQTERQQETVISQSQPSSKASLQPTTQRPKSTSEQLNPTTPVASNPPVSPSPSSVPGSQSSPTNQPDQPLTSVALARQQLLKWITLAGVGIVGAIVASQFLGHQPPSPQLSTSSTSSLSATPTSAQDFFNRGRDKYDKSDYEGAIKDYDQVIQLDPNYVNVHYNRGLAKYALRDNQGAIADYNQAIKLNPNYTDAYYTRGLAKYALGDNQGAVAGYDQAIKFNPSYTDAYYNRGLAKYALRDNQGAVADYNQAIKLNPNYTDAYYNRGLAKYGLGDKQGAIADYNQAVKLNPNYTDAYYGRGLAKYGLGDKQGAIADSNQVIKLDPNYASAYYNRGNAKYGLGDKQGAITDYKQAADLYQQQGETKNYQDTLEQIKKLQ